mgnify:CR=1 FL=1
MQALILAGGLGTRLHPYTMVFPKPMLPVGGRPIIQTVVDQLAAHGFSEIVISLGHLGNYLRMFFAEAENVPTGVSIDYVEEDEPLGTAAPVSLIEKPGDDFLVLNGDILTTLNFSDFRDFHLQRSATLSIAVGIKHVRMNLGVLELGEDDQVVSMAEKPTYTYHDNMGIYMYNRRALDYIEPGKRLDLPDLATRLIEDGEKVCGFVSQDPYYWIDIGQHADYEKANQEFESRRSDFLVASE